MFSTGGSHEKLLTIYDSPLLQLIVPKVFLITPNFSVLGGIFHKDWVSIEMLDDGLSFFGSTLKRNWAEEQEIENVKNLAVKAITSGMMDQVTAFKFALNFIEVNQHHFLAGRRSWAVGYNKQLKKWYVETMAFERNSQCEYSMLEKTGILREQILNIWINLLVNFTKYLENFDLLPLSETDNPYEFKESYTFSEKRVAYKVSEGKSATALLQKPWVANALKRHPGLIKGL